MSVGRSVLVGEIDSRSHSRLVFLRLFRLTDPRWAAGWAVRC